MNFRSNRVPRIVLQHLAALAAFSLASYALYAPPAAQAGGTGFTYFGHGTDPLAYIWFLNWWPFALLHHLPLFYSRFVDAPIGAALAWKTSIPALSLLAAPFTARYGAVAVANFLFLAAPALTAWFGYLAAFELTASFAPACVAGLVVGFSTYMIGQLQGHLNLAFIPAIPLAFWLCTAAFRRGWKNWRLGLPLGCVLAFQFGVSQEIFASFCMFGCIGLATLFVLDPAKRRGLAALIPGLALGLAISLLLDTPYIWQMLLYYRTGSTVSLAVNVSNDLLEFVFPDPVDLLGGNTYAPLSLKYPGNLSEESGYIGAPLLALLIYICCRNRSIPVYRTLNFMALLAAILSLGPRLHVWGVILCPAPWILLYKLPFLKAMLPARFMLYAFGAIALLLAFWLASPGFKYHRYIIAACCLVFLFPSQAMDRSWVTLQIPAVLMNGAIPPGSNVLILPELGSEIGYQYAAGMRFNLVGQGYLSSGAPLPFATWPLFAPLFFSEFQQIDGKQFATYLCTYHTNYVVVTNQTYLDYRHNIQLDTNSARAAALALLHSAGWTVKLATSDATLLQAPPASSR